MSLFLCTCTDGEELSIDHQEFDPAMRDTPCNKRFHILTKEEHQEQDCQQVG